ncbi:hypothetical protein [Chelatococcus reniformis]|uniref:Uncharacterized protein n=1 Tax=Chelatococcus reniformis TaxID=1494448 RepID=A0A916XFZ0_9HYPH|nr:hypothetical protein [Chelatococcus reniformis]GGC70659.1 hypothetical protein GCM10010994_31510 [Chelatococcus reniformis]
MGLKIGLVLMIAITLGIGWLVRSLVPSACDDADMVVRAARGGMKALLIAPEKAQFPDDHQIHGLGSEEMTVVGSVHTNEPRRETEKKQFKVKLSCASQMYLQVLEAEITTHSAFGRS